MNPCSFHENEGQTWQWAGGEKHMVHPKSQGRGFTISNFIEEATWWICSWLLRNMS